MRCLRRLRDLINSSIGGVPERFFLGLLLVSSLLQSVCFLPCRQFCMRAYLIYTLSFFAGMDCKSGSWWLWLVSPSTAKSSGSARCASLVLVFLHRSRHKCCWAKGRRNHVSSTKHDPSEVTKLKTNPVSQIHPTLVFGKSHKSMISDVGK